MCFTSLLHILVFLQVLLKIIQSQAVSPKHIYNGLSNVINMEQ